MSTLDPAVAAHFRRFDTDGNSHIDFDEFRRLLSHLGLRRSTDVMRRLFDTIDHDGNGRISLKEFGAWWSVGQHDSQDAGKGG